MEVSILILPDAFVRHCDLITGRLSMPVSDILINRQGVHGRLKETKPMKRRDVIQVAAGVIAGVASGSLQAWQQGVALRQIPVSPAWPEAKTFVIQEMPYYTRVRVIFQTRTRFWKADRVSPNWTPTDPRLNELWATAEEVQTPRGILLGGAQAGTAPADSLAAFHKLYPGKSADIEQVISHDWSKDPYAGMCERISYMPGELARYWPEGPSRWDESILRERMQPLCRGARKPRWSPETAQPWKSTGHDGAIRRRL